VTKRSREFAENPYSDVRSSEFARNPYAYYRRLRDRGGIHFLPEENAWLVVGYELASWVFRQPSIFSSSPFAVQSPSLHGADPPEHTLMRRLLAPYFTPERQYAQRASVERHVSRTMARLETLTVFDAVTDLATPIPFSVACEWLGLREDVATTLHHRPIPDVSWDEIKPALLSNGVIPELARDPNLTEAQLAEFASFFLAASNGTSRDLLLLGLSVLIDRPDVVARVTADMSLLPALVEELLRLEPAAHTLLRRTRTEVVLDGKTVPEGSLIWVSIGAANRDPEAFPDPDQLRLDRSTSRHLAFGVGPHFCLGSPLGRMQSQLILARLLPEMHRIRSAGPMEIGFWDDFPGGAPIFRVIRSWPLKFVPY